MSMDCGNLLFTSLGERVVSPGITGRGALGSRWGVTPNLPTVIRF